MSEYRIRGFRPSKENQVWLTRAEKLKLNISQVINEVLEENLPRHLQEKVERMRVEFNTPVH